MADDIPNGSKPLTLHKSVESFLIGLGQRDEVEIDPDEIRARALILIKSGLEHSRALPRATFDQAGDELEFRTLVTDGKIDRVGRARRFTGELGVILLVDATWTLSFRLLYREFPPDDESSWFVVDRLTARGQVQVYLAETKSEPTGGQFIAAQLKPSQTVWLTGDSLSILGERTD